jgi:16S rRNA (uracil1498-N3)-methyltransferase
MNVFIGKVNGNTGELNEEESWHCARVLRSKPGEKINIIDGHGTSYEGILELVTDKKCTFKITGTALVQAKRNYYLHVAIAPTKQIDRIEWFVEKAVEIGIDEISFIQCANSERISLKRERIVKIVESAVKQSLQAFIPNVSGLIKYKSVLDQGEYDLKLIAHCFNGSKEELKKMDFKNKRILALVGPEGDFTLSEIQEALSAGFKEVSLGDNRLRTETAGLYVCQAVSLFS